MPLRIAASSTLSPASAVKVRLLGLIVTRKDMRGLFQTQGLTGGARVPLK
jgi:hypothetical protein